MTRQITDTEIAKIVDEERGFLDRRAGLGCGFSGPATPAYLVGYGDDLAMQEKIRTVAERRNNYIEHGWH